jgi:hypothetical protein
MKISVRYESPELSKPLCTGWYVLCDLHYFHSDLAEPSIFSAGFERT